MLFNSLTFAAFFTVVYAAFLGLRGWTARKWLLLVASYLFYAAWNPPYALLLFASTSIDWWLARHIGRSQNRRVRRALLIASLGCNLGVLSYFKYGNFLLQNSVSVLALAGIQLSPPTLDIVLPIGISFYTFASLSYTIDVYRNDVHGQWHFRDYALFVSFFPHLVAGPIVRARMLLPQIEQPSDPTADQIGWGLCLVAAGLFAKTLADNLFAPVVDQVYGHAAQAGAWEAWTAVFGFSAQIYYDFAGYSACAIGLALCFGFRFPDNFRYPYAARGFSDFWRRWHISLSTWLRDYLYMPLGGSWHGTARTYGNLALTMLIGGLWHGASWMFVLWGGLHGLYLAVERGIRERRPVDEDAPPSTDAALTVLTFVIVSLTWIPFRAPSMAIVRDLLKALISVSVPAHLPATALALAGIGAALMLIVHWQLRDASFEAVFARQPDLVQATFIAGCLIALFLFSGGDQRAFIYFQF